LEKKQLTGQKAHSQQSVIQSEHSTQQSTTNSVYQITVITHVHCTLILPRHKKSTSS